MKITKRCTPIENQIWLGRCQSCKSEAEAERKELNVEHDRDGELGRADCPVCERKGTMIFYPPR
jgi:hypothetical protein